MTWPFENDTSAIVKKLADRSMKADKRSKTFLLYRKVLKSENIGYNE